MGATDFIKAMNEPICKLIDALKTGIGVLYEPTHLKKMADAESYRIEKIGESIRNNADLPIEYHGKTNELGIDIKDAQALLARTVNRILFQEVQRQKNLDSIVAKTYVELEHKTECSKEKVNPDWMLRFAEAAQNISDEELQNLWAKILTGEIIMPNSCSLRAIETLKNMSKNEFDVFLKICPFICNGFLCKEDGILDQFDINYGMLLILDECNLINSTGAVLTISSKECAAESVKFFDSQNYILLGKSNKKFRVYLPVYKLTESGNLLRKLAVTDDEYDFMLAYGKHLRTQYKSINFGLYKIICRKEVNIEYNEENLLDK